jgi:hypothetical protein
MLDGVLYVSTPEPEHWRNHLSYDILIVEIDMFTLAIDIQEIESGNPVIKPSRQRFVCNQFVLAYFNRQYVQFYVKE